MTSNHHTILWAFSILPHHQKVFEAAYGSQGSWVQLFSGNRGYCYTRLYRNITNPENNLLHYLCEDVWETQESYEVFLANHQQEYQALDELCASWTISEHPLVVQSQA